MFVKRILTLGTFITLPPIYFYYRNDIYKNVNSFTSSSHKELENSYVQNQVSDDSKKYIINPKNSQDYNYVKDLNREGLTIFSLTYCIYCKKLRWMLDDMGVNYKNIECDIGEMDNDAVNDLCTSTEAPTFPKLFIKDTFYQGFNENMLRRKNGTLAEIFKNNGINYERA